MSHLGRDRGEPGVACHLLLQQVVEGQGEASRGGIEISTINCQRGSNLEKGTSLARVGPRPLVSPRRPSAQRIELSAVKTDRYWKAPDSILRVVKVKDSILVVVKVKVGFSSK